MHDRSARSALGTLCNVALAFAAGALAMYLMDPNTGRRRRAMMRDRGVSMRHDAERYVRGKSKRAADRLRGVAARTRASLASEPVDDDLLHERIRSRLGRLVERPHDVEVRVHGGHVQLKGHVSEDEFHELLHTVSSMRGVQNLESLLRTHPAHSMQTSAPH
ncbi:BON domain-containing protein [Lysobacter changpingensis]|uniref:BON domain-containing protein n=1 Tax=Lysobacter changpingensis TaxID=2792784 RepID=UPI001A8E0AC5|nr:BON domain-containing protein [Lysobacter changpingensis]